MFSSAPPAGAERRARGGAVRRSQSRAGSIAALAAGSNAGTPPPLAKTGPRSRGLSARAGSSRRQSLLPPGRTASRQSSRLSPADPVDEGSPEHDNAVLYVQDDSAQNEHEGVLLKSDTHAVTILGGLPRSFLPAEVIDVLANSDFYTDPHTAVLDTKAGYACLAGKTKCYVWSLEGALQSETDADPRPSPTCYTFPVPDTPEVSLSAAVFSPVPFVAFVATHGGSGSSTSREPGFLLVTTWGQAAYWNTVSAALSGVQNNVQYSAGLSAGEVIRTMTPLSPMRYTIGTSAGRLFALRIETSFSSNAILSIKPISKARGMLARVGNLFAATSINPQGGIAAVVAYKGKSSQKEQSLWSAFAVSDRIVQEWRFTEAGEEFVAETDIHDVLFETLCNILGCQEQDISRVEVVDAAIQDSSTLVVLIAYSPSSDDRSASSHRRQVSYALAQIRAGTVIYMKSLSYTHDVDPRPLSTPRVRLIPQEKLCFAIFPELVIATFLDASIPFEESVALKDAAKDRILGANVDASSTLMILAACTGLLKLEIDVPFIRNAQMESARLDPADLATRNIKNKLEQAIMYADNHQNPLAFRLALRNEAGDLVSAAESVSKDVLCSSSIYLPTILDLRAQMADRTSRLSLLMQYLHDYNLMKRLSKTSKRHLAWDAERLAGAMALWVAHSQDRHNTVLEQAARTVLSLEANAEDVIRQYFRHHLNRLEVLLEAYLPVLQSQAVEASLPLNERTQTLFQVDRDLALVYRAVNRHRVEQGNLYGIPLGPDSQTCLSEPWTSRPTLLKLLRLAFEATEALLTERSREIGSNIDDSGADEYGSTLHLQSGRVVANIEEERQTQHLLKAYLVDLADHTLAMHQERMSYLQSLGDDHQAVSELRDLLDTYVRLRPRVIDAMVRLSRINAAYDLAERYRDFRALVVLCNDPSIGSPARVHFFIQKYKQDFAFALYDWYLESGRTYDLLTQDATYSRLVSDFLKLRNLPGLSWMQDIVEDKMKDAADALLRQAQLETSLSEQKLMLSIGKLARMASYTRSQVEEVNQVPQQLLMVDERLDIVASHDHLLNLSRSILDPRDLLKPVETQATVLLGRLCSHVTNAEVMKLGSFLFRRLLLGDALLPEDLADLYSLKDNATDEQAEDFANGLQLLDLDRQTPQTRRDIAVRTVWRRVYLADDFVEIRRLASSGSDDALAQRLRSTALHATLVACRKKDLMTLRPSEVLYTSTQEEDSSLFARFSSEVYHGDIAVESIASEYARESHLIQGMVEDKMVRLEEFFDEVHRLVKVDADQATAGQGSILAEMNDSIME